VSFDPAAHGWTIFEDKALPKVHAGHWRLQEEGDAFAYGFQTSEDQANGRGVVHGGILATYMDHTIGRTAWNAVKPRHIATIQLDIHYLAAVRPGEFVEARGEITRLTRAVIFVRGGLTVAGKPVLAASGIWKILGA
jgi:uncharacterized protein (TIGR00369 family)